MGKLLRSLVSSKKPTFEKRSSEMDQRCWVFSRILFIMRNYTVSVPFVREFGIASPSICSNDTPWFNKFCYCLFKDWTRRIGNKFQSYATNLFFSLIFYCYQYELSSFRASASFSRMSSAH